jgi:ribosomal protein S8
MNDQLFLSLSNLKRAAIMKQAYVTVNSDKSTLSILNIFFKANIINTYKQIDNKKITVFINYKNGRSLLTFMQFKKKLIDNESYIKLYKKYSDYPLVIVKTQFGFMPINMCFSRRIGGKVIIIMYAY